MGNKAWCPACGQQVLPGAVLLGNFENCPAPQTAHGRQVGGDHYRNKAIQPWDAMAEWMSSEQFAGFLRGNAIKYLSRAEDKGGIEDYRKARHYLDKLIEYVT